MIIYINVIIQEALFSFSQEIYADYFKWQIHYSAKGFATEIEIFLVSAEGKLEFSEKEISCRMEKFWTRIEADLLLEAKTLVCENGDEKQSVIVVCRDNHLNRKYNQYKELYPLSKGGFRIKLKGVRDSPYLELRCYF